MSRFFTIGALACLGLMLASTTGCNEAQGVNPEPDLTLAATLRAGGGSGGSAEAGPVSTGTGWGTIKGRFVYAGDPPNLGTIPTGKDMEVCGTSAPNQSLVVGPDKGIDNIVIYLNKAPRVFKPEGGEEPATTTVPLFDQKGCIFLTHVMGMQTKDTLRIKNSDSVAHNTSFSPGGRNNSTNPQLQPQTEATYKWQSAINAPAEVSCSIHPWMKGYIIARDDPYFAVTKPDGTFEIKNVPAGEDLEFRVWHERAPGGLEAKSGWSKGRFKVKVPADDVEDLGDINVPTTAFR